MRISGGSCDHIVSDVCDRNAFEESIVELL